MERILLQVDIKNDGPVTLELEALPTPKQDPPTTPAENDKSGWKDRGKIWAAMGSLVCREKKENEEIYSHWSETRSNPACWPLWDSFCFFFSDLFIFHNAWRAELVHTES